MTVDEQRQLYAMLTDLNPQVRQRAREMLDVVDPDVVGVLGVVFRDENLAYAWPDCLDLLMDTGIEALNGSEYPGRLYDRDKFDRLVGTLVAAPTDMVIGGRLAATLGLRPGTRLCRWTLDAASEPAPGIDGGRVLPAPTLEDFELGRVPIMVALLASEIDWMRKAARFSLSNYIDAFPGCRESMAEMLRAMRRSRVPARARRAALDMLAGIGWYEIELADRALLQRLIRIKLLRTETLLPVDMEASWYALPTSDQAAVLDVFGLCDPVPVTMHMGFAAFDADHWAMDSKQVFVTPALDGWTLVISDHGLIDKSDDDARRRCAELSRRFGVAHWYTQSIASGCDDFSGWCVAEAGTLLAHCFYDHSGQGPWTGPPDPATGRTLTIEQLRAWIDLHARGTGRPPPPPPPPPSRQERKGQQMQELRLLSKIFERDLKELEERADSWLDEDKDNEEQPRELGIDPRWELEVSKVAWRLSVCPEGFGPHTQVEGTGVMAVPVGMRHRRCGALPIGATTN